MPWLATPGNCRTLQLIGNDDFFIKQALLLYVNAFAVPGVARLRPYGMAFLLREQTVET
jgi:hypothetical protein